MPYQNPPWPPEMDQEAVEFYNKLEEEKYDGHVDDIGTVRWSSEWRMHRGNGMNSLDATVAVFKSIDAIRAGQPPPQNPPGPYDTPWDPSLDAECTPFCNNLENLYEEHQSRPVDETGWVRWSSDYRIARANGLSPALAWQKIQREIMNIWGIQPPVGEVTPKPIVGQLQRRGNTFGDETGLITPIFSSEFVLLRVLKLEPERYEQMKSDLIRYRLQGSRIFTNVGGWAGFWDDTEVVFNSFTKWQFDRKDGHLRPATDANGNNLYGPRLEAWPDADDLLAKVCADFSRARLCIHFTTGDCQIIYCDIVNGRPIYNFEKELEHHRRVARVIKSIDKQVAAVYEIRNEYPMNSPFGGQKQDRDNMGKIIKEVKNILGSDVLCGLGAALSEEPEDLVLSAEHSDVCFQHTTRSPFELCLKRTLGLRYWEGEWGTFPWPYMQGEPKPMNVPPFGDGVGDDGYAPTDQVADLIALHTMIAMTSQGGNLFTGASVKLKTYPSYMPGYREIPAIIEEHIPEKVAGASRETAGHGAILYFTYENRFVTSTHENWDTTPPRPVASWKMYTGRGTEMEVLEGSGNPPQGRTGFIVGTFA